MGGSQSHIQGSCLQIAVEHNRDSYNTSVEHTTANSVFFSYLRNLEFLGKILNVGYGFFFLGHLFQIMGVTITDSEEVALIYTLQCSLLTCSVRVRTVRCILCQEYCVQIQIMSQCVCDRFCDGDNEIPTYIK